MSDRPDLPQWVRDSLSSQKGVPPIIGLRCQLEAMRRNSNLSDTEWEQLAMRNGVDLADALSNDPLVFVNVLFGMDRCLAERSP